MRGRKNGSAGAATKSMATPFRYDLHAVTLGEIDPRTPRP